MANSKIEEDILVLEEYINNCKGIMFGRNEIKVEKEVIDSMIADLKADTPTEIAQYRKMLANRENIIADANAKAEAIMNEAKIASDNLLSENQLMQQAYAKANEIVQAASIRAEEILNNATMQANEIKIGAMEYTDSELRAIETILSTAIDSTQSRTQNLIMDLSNILQVVSQNRAQLAPPSPVSNMPDGRPTDENSEE